MAHHDGYKWFIEQLVLLAGKDVLAGRIRQNGHPERINDADLPLSSVEQERKDFFLSLSSRQKELLADLVQERRHAALHDVACFLEGEVVGGALQMAAQGEALSDSPFTSYHFDFSSRLDGEEWPPVD